MINSFLTLKQISFSPFVYSSSGHYLKPAQAPIWNQRLTDIVGLRIFRCGPALTRSVGFKTCTQPRFSLSNRTNPFYKTKWLTHSSCRVEVNLWMPMANNSLTFPSHHQILRIPLPFMNLKRAVVTPIKDLLGGIIKFSIRCTSYLVHIDIFLTL